MSRIAAHRGASAHAPDNSLAAMRLALAQGADGCEFDVHATRDGAFLVTHDATIPGRGPIAELTAAELADVRLANGEPIPTLAEVLAALPGMVAWVEVKGLAAEWDSAFLTLLDRANAPRRTAVHSFNHRVIARLRAQAPSLSVGVLQSSYPLDPLAAVRATGADALWQHWELIDGPLVGACRAAGIALVAWTVPTAAVPSLAALGVDVLCVNDPAAARRALATLPHPQES